MTAAALHQMTVELILKHTVWDYHSLIITTEKPYFLLESQFHFVLGHQRPLDIGSVETEALKTGNADTEFNAKRLEIHSLSKRRKHAALTLVLISHPRL